MEAGQEAHVARQLQFDESGQRFEQRFPLLHPAHAARGGCTRLPSRRLPALALQLVPLQSGPLGPRRRARVTIYAVGGAVQDELLGLPVADRDHVVVGSTPEEMVRLGYKPVGKDFPVFLHPRTHEEHALARTERKVARGYKGFQIHAAPDVTLEQDLERRDLTINAMARDDAGRLVDPFGGAADLERGLLRHVSPAFVEDPVRILVRALECAAAERLGLAPRFALVAFGAPDAQATRALSERLKAPGDCRDLAVLARRHAETIRRAPALAAPELLELLEHCDALRRTERFEELLAVIACVERGERGWAEIPYVPRVVLRRALGAATGVDAAKIAAQGAKPDIAARLRRARIAAIEALG